MTIQLECPGCARTVRLSAASAESSPECIACRSVLHVSVTGAPEKRKRPTILKFLAAFVIGVVGMFVFSTVAYELFGAFPPNGVSEGVGVSIMLVLLHGRELASTRYASA